MKQGPHRNQGVEGPGGRRRRRTAGVLGGVAMAAMAVTVAACGSSTPAVTFNHATYASDIKSAYGTLFNLSNPNVTAKVAVVQDGTAIKGTLQQALSSSLASSSKGTTVHTTTLWSTSQCTGKKLPSPCAKVVYDIDGPTGSAVLSNMTGYAVYQNGKWLVAKTSICDLLGLFYQAEGKSGNPPGC